MIDLREGESHPFFATGASEPRQINRILLIYIILLGVYCFFTGCATLSQGPQNPLELGHRQGNLPRRSYDPKGSFRREQGMLERQGRQVAQGKCVSGGRAVNLRK